MLRNSAVDVNLLSLSAHPPFDLGDAGQDEPRQQRREQGDGDAAEADGDADGRRQPDPGGGRQPLHVTLFVALQDSAGPDEPYTDSDALHHAPDFADRYVQFEGDQHEDRRAQRDQHVGAQPRRLVGTLTLQPDDRPDDRGCPEADEDARQLLRVGNATAELL
jgi:hypothetical protein